MKPFFSVAGHSIPVDSLPRGVTIILLDYTGDHFWVSKRKTASGEGRWQFPGGHVEETDFAPVGAAIRELSEETGLKLYGQDRRFVPLGEEIAIGYKGELYLGYRFGVRLCRDETPEQTEPDKATPWVRVTAHELAALAPHMIASTAAFALLFAQHNSSS